MRTHVPQSVGLGGDGDEIAAMRDVEAEFGVRLDYSDAANWHTAGDVYRALCNTLSPDDAAKSDTWDRFAKALSQQTGVDPRDIQADSALLSESRFWARMATINAYVWMLACVVLLVGAGFVIFF